MQSTEGKQEIHLTFYQENSIENIPLENKGQIDLRKLEWDGWY
jgi:hypothetical protein